MADQVEIKGLKELLFNLQELPRRLEKAALTNAAKAALVPIRDEAVRLAPELQKPDPRRRRGTVKNHIRILVAKPYPGMATTVVVRVKRLTAAQVSRFKARASKKRGQFVPGSDNPNDPYYWWWQEFGTSRMPARAFMRRAFEAQKLAAIALAKPAIAREIEVQAEKMRK